MKNSICFNCTHIKVCKHYDYLSDNFISASSCENYSVTANNKVQAVNAVQAVHNLVSRGYRENLNKKKDEKTQKETVNCPTCNKIDYKDEIGICDRCNKPICGNCSTSLGEEVLCDDCFKEGDK